MLKPIAVVASCAVAIAAMTAFITPVDARTVRTKANKAQTPQKMVRSPRIAERNGGWEAFPGNPGFRDRTTINHPNGRLNGQEFFDSIADRAGDIGN